MIEYGRWNATQREMLRELGIEVQMSWSRPGQWYYEPEPETFYERVCEELVGHGLPARTAMLVSMVPSGKVWRPTARTPRFDRDAENWAAEVCPQ